MATFETSSVAADDSPKARMLRTNFPASQMNVEVRTLEKHRERSYEKLNVYSAVKIAKYLGESGLS